MLEAPGVAALADELRGQRLARGLWIHAGIEANRCCRGDQPVKIAATL